jgi:hypothetical protein
VKSKKAQMEMIGFLVIILLLFFSLIFYFKFASSDSTNLLQEAEENLEVSNLLSVIKQYTVCEGTQLKDVIKTCAEGGGTECSQDACELVTQNVQAIVAMNEWDETQYMFYIADELYSPATCVGNTFVDEYVTGGQSVRLVYCY